MVYSKLPTAALIMSNAQKATTEGPPITAPAPKLSFDHSLCAEAGVQDANSVCYKKGSWMSDPDLPCKIFLCNQ